MNRNVPPDVKKILRKEVGFGCPVPGCGLPYLEWHHFDPPWREENHHRPEGMVALCRQHHIEADNGAFTKQQLHHFKISKDGEWQKVQGKFNWMRNKLLTICGSCFFYENDVILRYKGNNIIYLSEDENGCLLLNLKMLSTDNEERAHIIDNEWCNTGGEEDIECPPSARKVKISYPNGDYISAEFYELLNMDDLIKRYPESGPVVSQANLEFPITALEISGKDTQTGLEFTPKLMNLSSWRMANCMSKGHIVGILIN